MSIENAPSSPVRTAILVERHKESERELNLDLSSLRQTTLMASMDQNSCEAIITLLEIAAGVDDHRNGNPNSIASSVNYEGRSVSPSESNHSALRPAELELPPQKANEDHSEAAFKQSSCEEVDAGEKPYRCEDCPSSYATEKSLRAHRRIHSGPRCCLCGRRFTDKWNLELHLRSHTGEKPYSCTTCGDSFSAKSTLRTHVFIHTGEKPYRCSICGESFRQIGYLREHMLVHTGQKPHSCSFCGKSFGKAGNLKDHIRIHTGEKPHMCCICGKSFVQQNQVKKHMLSHIRGMQGSANGGSSSSGADVESYATAQTLEQPQ